MANVTHKTVKTNGISMHVVEHGTGPTCLLLHGFPEFWWSWRYQIPALVEAGYHVVVPDLRGCGQTESPSDAGSYTTLNVVGDLVGLLDALGEKRVFVVGHDWGATVAWDLCLFRPDLVKAVVCFSFPFRPRMPDGGPLKRLREILGEGFFQIRFQEPGRAERDFEKTGTKLSLAKILYTGARDIFIAPEGKELMESLPTPERQPPWISDFDIQFYVEDKEKSGWTGGLNYYRCMDKTYELKAPWTGAVLNTKALFIAGKDDLVIKLPGLQVYVDNNFKNFVPNLQDIVYLEGGHFIQQEQPTKINELLIAFFKGINDA